jgi:hypothetical protein
VCVCACQIYVNFQNVESGFWRADSGQKKYIVLNGVTSVEGTEHSGCPLASRTDGNVDLVKELVLRKRRTTICEVLNVRGNFICVKSGRCGIVFALTVHLLCMLCLCTNFRIKTKCLSFHTHILTTFTTK